ncbi:MAG TPA: response regulator transcription factor [Candidatus Saccharimonadales bacterium]|nr:response regulator transcription factor [Candidatus Saccharimonadales bacterium]
MSPHRQSAASKRTRILLVDDHPMMRQGLAALIGSEPDLEICGQAENAAKAMAALAAHPTDLVLLDLTLPDKNGVEVIKDMRALHPAVRVLVVSMHDEAIYAERVLRAGARGYIMKQEGGPKLLQAIREVLAGQISVSEKVSARILELFSGRSSGASPMEKLTDREFEVFQLIGQGLATRQIAAKLHLSVKTVEVHRLHIKEKLAIASAPELVRFAVRWVEAQGRG